MMLRFVYSQTKDMGYPGPGTMFIFAGMLYLVAAACACALPKDKANSKREDVASPRDSYGSIEEGSCSSVDERTLL
jgi:hypothetical protein